ncbi:MAG: EAL domain-containing protein [Leptospiraceae bacterium]|nr:EAL domain-containing protein [Leptospiraceae bacterium]
MHPFLDDLIRQYFGDTSGFSPEWMRFVQAIDRHLVELEHSHTSEVIRKKRELSIVNLDERPEYNQLMLHAPFGFVILFENQLDYVNDAAVAMTQSVSAESMLGRSVFDFIYPSSHDEARRYLRLLEAGQPVPPTEIQFCDVQGRPIPVIAAASPIISHGKRGVQVLFQDVSERNRIRSMLEEIVTGISAHVGTEFYEHFVSSLAQTLNVEVAYLAQVASDDPATLETCAVWYDNALQSNFRFATADTPCQQVLGRTIMTLQGEELQPYADNPLINRNQIQCYIGVPLFNRRREPLGVAVIMTSRRINETTVPLSILRIFAERAAAEMERQHAERQLSESEKNYRLLMEQAADGIVVFDASGHVQYVNQKMCDMMSLTLADVRGQPISFFMPIDEAREIPSLFRRLARERTIHIDRSVRRTDGSSIRVAVSVTLLEDRRIQAILRDMTQKLKAEEERQSYLDTLAMLEEVAIELDTQLHIIRVSNSWDKLMKTDDEDSPLGRSFEDYIHSDYRYFLNQRLRSILKERARAGSTILRFPVPYAEGANMWLEGKFVSFTNGEGQVAGLRGVLRDVTIEHLTDRQITFYAYYDVLTGLPNRLRLEENLIRSISRAEHSEARLALGIIDMDNFDEINTYLGHRAGDRILLSVADRLRDILGAGETLYRWGGDKFVAMLPYSERDELDKLSRRLLSRCHQPIQLDERPVHIFYSIGFALYPDDGLNADMLMGEANRALTYAKAQGKYNFQFAGGIPRRGFYKEQIQIRSELSSAIASGRIQVYYQPKVNAADHEIIGMEALARWPGQEGGMRASPSIFIPLAENMGLIGELGRHIMEQSLTMQRQFKQKGKTLKMSVNISRRQLFEEGFVDWISGLVRRYGNDPEDIILEITESIAMLEVDFAYQRLQQLHDAGFRLSIDDFGTGYSTLSQLHEMPVDELKVDMSFVRRIDTYEGLQVVQAITNMGRALSLDVVAEGVENKQTASRLLEVGVNILQGNYFSEAVPAARFEELVNGSGRLPYGSVD